MWTWSVKRAGCCCCLTLILLIVSIFFTLLSNQGLLRGEGLFCDRRCNDEAAEEYRIAEQETCFDDEGAYLGYPCDWSNVTDKPAKVEPVEGHYHCYFEGDAEAFTYECLGMEYPTLGVTALVLAIFIFSIFMLTRACRARVTPSAAEKMQEASSAADSAPVAEQPIANVPAESG